jgi:hypothetical protein
MPYTRGSYEVPAGRRRHAYHALAGRRTRHRPRKSETGTQGGDGPSTPHIVHTQPQHTQVLAVPGLAF